MEELPNIFLLDFAPERWTNLHKLALFVGPPFPNDGNVRIGLRDCERHLNRSVVYFRILGRLRPNLSLDREELKKYGGSSNMNSQEYAAIAESVITTLYSALDGLRTFLFGAYRNVAGVQNGSNGKLFQRAKEQKYGEGFPADIATLLAKAWDDWFASLRDFRTELTHGSTGSCHLDEATGRIGYFNDGIKIENRSFMLEDIDAYLGDVEARVRELVESIAGYHFQKLDPAPHFAMCGFYKGRWYGRMVEPSRDMHFGSGSCLSYDWFESTEGQFCPMASRCEAYSRKWPGGSAGMSGG